jgi:hypothetical protein
VGVTVPSEVGRDWPTLGVAAYGAAVATGVAIYQFRRDRSGVKIILTPVASFAEDRAPVEFWAIRVVNHKPRPITIRSVGLLVEKRRGVGMLSAPYLDEWGSPTDSPFPVTLTDGSSVEVGIERPLDSGPKGARAIDDLERSFAVRHPSLNPRKRWWSWRVRRRYMKLLKRAGERTSSSG